MIKIEKKELCCGCESCVSACPKQCITLKIDEEGFGYPEIELDNCIQCGLCEKSCPIINSERKNNKVDKPRAYALKSKNDVIRENSSSGGVFTLLAEKIINAGGVVFGAAMTEDLKSVEHIQVCEKKNLEKLRGSKYLQSTIGNSYIDAKGYLDQGRYVLFSGTPCQIEGLKHYLKKEYDNLLCIDFICHGVPSSKVWQRYVKYQEEKVGTELKRVLFRNKDTGWKNYSVSLEFSDNQVTSNVFVDDLFMRAFLRDICLRPSCHECKFKKKNRVSDITLADFWGITNVLPEMDDDKGTSLVITHSEIGQQYMEKIFDDTIWKEVDVDIIPKYNSAMVLSSKPHKNRKDFFENLERQPFDKLVNRYAVIKISYKERIKNILNNLGLWGFVKGIYKRVFK